MITANQLRALNGQEWYSQQATRAVNQAIGRVIRHVQDYGMIVLLDERFKWGSNMKSISKWLRDHIFPAPDFSRFDIKMRAFFQQMSQMNFAPKVKQLEELTHYN